MPCSYFTHVTSGESNEHSPLPPHAPTLIFAFSTEPPLPPRARSFYIMSTGAESGGGGGGAAPEGRVIDETKTWGTGPRKIDLRSPQGNSMKLVGIALQFAKRLQMPEEGREAMCEDMLSGDYLHVLETFEKLWGGYATLFYGVRFMRAHTISACPSLPRPFHRRTARWKALMTGRRGVDDWEE